MFGLLQSCPSKEKWTVFTGNKVIWKDCSDHQWLTDVKEVILGGERHYPLAVTRHETWSVVFGRSRQSFLVGGSIVSTTSSSQPNFALKCILVINQFGRASSFTY